MANVPTSIGRYRVVKSIGHGGMGDLYLAWDNDLERNIVIKVLREDHDELRVRFSREAKSAARLKHKHIVTIFELGDFESQPYIAMEYIEGPTLAEVISGREQPPLSRKLGLMAQLCEGLGYAHKAGVVHRDIKPANIMIHKDGDLKILDFGVARIAESASMTQAGMLIGTLSYMSPEQVSGASIDHRSDIFAVGSVFYELLALKKAFPGTIATGVLGKILNGLPEPLRDVCPGLNEDVIRIIGRAIEKDVGSRYQDLESMRRDLLTVQQRLEEQSDPKRILDRPAWSPDPTRRSTARGDLDRRRESQVQYYLDLAGRAMAESQYDSVIASCEQALLLDAENVLALELVERARAESDGQQAQQLLDEAERELERGALTLASDLVEQAAALRPSPQQARLREEIDAAIEQREQSRRRVEAVKAAVERGTAALDAGAFAEAVRFADEALATDPAHTAAATVKAKAVEHLARVAREAAEQRALEAILEARQRFAKGDHSGAIAILERFSPPHDAVSRTLTELVADAARIAAERKREAEARAKQQRIAGVLALSREELRDQRFASALERLHTLERVEGTTAGITELIGQVMAAEAAERKAKEEADRAAAARRREAEARAKKQRIAEEVSRARGELRDQRYASARERLVALMRTEGATPEITQLLQDVEQAEVHRKAQQEEEAAWQEEQVLAAARDRAQAAAAARDLQEEPTVHIDPPQVPEPALPTAYQRVQTPRAGQTRKIAIAAGIILVAGVGGYFILPRPGPVPEPGTATSSVATTTPTTTTAPPSDDNSGKDLLRATSLANAGLTLLGQGRLGQAEAKFREAQAVVETRVATTGLEEVARRRGEYQQRWQEGVRGAKAKDYNAALTSYTKAKDLDAESFARDSGEARLADVRSQISASDQAKAKGADEDRKRMLAEAARENASKLFGEGRELARQGRYDEAEAKYAEAIRQNKDHAEAANALERSRQYKQAKDRGESNAQSNNAQVLNDRAQALESARKIDGARFTADGLVKALEDVNRRLAPPPPTPSTPTSKPAPPPAPPSAPPTDERPATQAAIQARLDAFARAISTDTNKGKDNGLVRAIWPNSPPYFSSTSQYQRFEYTDFVLVTSGAGGDRQVVRCNQVQRYGPNAKSLTTLTEPVEIVIEKRNGTWFIVSLRLLK